MHFFIMGILMGYGVSLPVGPLNLEIIRRTFKFGSLQGIFLGLGAIISDLIYLFLITIGFLSFLNNGMILRIIGILGSLFIAYIGIKAIIPKTLNENNEKLVSHSYLTQILEGFFIAFINPFVIVFWISLSSQIATLTNNNFSLFLVTASGVITSAISWLLFLNIIITISRKKLSNNFINKINIIGGILLISIAGFCFIKNVISFFN